MKRLLLIIVLFPFGTVAFSQESLISNIVIRDTVNIKIEKIASRYGLDSRIVFQVTKSVDNYYVKEDSWEHWKIMNSYQWISLVEFEQKAIEKGCDSSTYATIETSFQESNEKLYCCWDKVDEITGILKLQK